MTETKVELGGIPFQLKKPRGKRRHIHSRGHHRLAPEVLMCKAGIKLESKKQVKRVAREEVPSQMKRGWNPVKRSVYRALSA